MISEEQVLGTTEEADVDSEAVNVADALHVLRKAFDGRTPPLGYLTGLTQMRNAIADKTGCSLLRAELLVEKLEADGALNYDGDTYSPEVIPGSWRIGA